MLGKTIVISILIVVLALAAIGVYAWHKRHDARREDIKAGRPVKGDLPPRTERLLISSLAEVDSLLRRISDPDLTQIDKDTSYLTDGDQQAVREWRARYQQIRRETTNA